MVSCGKEVQFFAVVVAVVGCSDWGLNGLDHQSM